ncbi:MAG: hypothetical protein IK143_04290 [Bacteroidales bacterium]|nr:hypothetical protein [Bacteroidales bacterium]
MEQNNEMSAKQSLELIAETINNSRKGIIRNSGKHFILWGILLTLFSLAVYFLWKASGQAMWNCLWFAMPLVGFPLSYCLRKKSDYTAPDNLISRMMSQTWRIFCIFSLSVAAVAMIIARTTTPIALIGITPALVLMFGVAESINGILLKNNVITVAGWLIGIGGLVIYYVSGINIGQMLIFTFAGIMLTLTGVIVKYQNR